MMTTFLFVPIQIEGLFLNKGREAAQAMADFSRLPYLKKHTDGSYYEWNTEQPFLSETVETTSAWLQPGVHLHWKLPTALTTAHHPHDSNGVQNRDTVEFPAVPNRWLVCRWLGQILQKSWLVESDYLWPPDFDLNTIPPEEREGLVSYPYHIDDSDGARILVEHPGEPPFRYIGRRRELKAAWPQTTPPEYLADIKHKLTAVGYGEASFAAYYPNCRSIFGLYDNTIIQDESLWYEVFGWYADKDDDLLHNFVSSLNPADLDAATFIGRYKSWFGRNLRFKLNSDVFAKLQTIADGSQIQQWQKQAEGDTFLDHDSFLAAIAAVVGKDVVSSHTNDLLSSGVDVAHRYRIDQVALDALTAVGLPQDVRDGLAKLQGRNFVGEQAFLGAVGTSGEPYRKDLLTNCRARESIWQQLYEHSLEERFNWSWPVGTQPDQMMCYGRIRRPGFAAPLLPQSDLKVAVANSGSEALAAFVADYLAEERFGDGQQRREEKERLENHLEAILLADTLAGQTLDIGATLADARHTKSFTATAGPPLWVIRPSRARNDQSQVDDSRESTLPAEIAHLLNSLNTAQQAYDHGRQRVESLRRQVYFDWYRYMQQAYPSDGDAARDYLASRATFEADHDIDVIIDFIKRRSLAEFYAAQEQVGEVLELAPDACRVRAFATLPTNAAKVDSAADVDPSTAMHVLSTEMCYAKQTWSPSPDASQPSSQAQELVVAWEIVRRLIDVHNNDPQQVTFTTNAFHALQNANLAIDDLQALQKMVGAVIIRTPDEPLQVTLAKTLNKAIKKPFEEKTMQHIWEIVIEPWELVKTTGPQFWRPNDPVLLLAGTTAKPIDAEQRYPSWYDDAGHLRCIPFDATDGSLEPKLLLEAGKDFHDALAASPLRVKLNALASQFDMNSLLPMSLYPFMLEWEAMIAPVRAGSNMPAISRSYDPNFIKQNWQLLETGFDFREDENLTTLTTSTTSFHGRSILVSYAHQQLVARLEEYILRRLRTATPCPGQADIPSYFDQFKVPSETQNHDHLVTNYLTIEDWIIKTRTTVELAAAKQAWAVFAKTTPSVKLASIPQVYGLPDQNALAQRILRFVNSNLGLDDKTREFFLSEVGLDDLSAQRLYRLGSVSLTSLQALDNALNPKAAETNATPLIQLLRYINGYHFIKNQRVVYTRPLVNGLPDGGWLAQGMLRIVNMTAADSLIRDAGLRLEAVESIEAAREIAPIASLYELSTLAGVTQATFARLLNYADAIDAFVLQAANEDEDHELIQGLDPAGHIAKGVLSMVKSVSLDELDHKVGLHKEAAKAIFDDRENIHSIRDLDNKPYINQQAFARMVHYAYTRYYIDSTEHYSDNPSTANTVHDILEGSEVARLIIALANQASLEMLDDEVGLNSQTAKELIKTRTLTPFTSLAQIGQVNGVGPATMAKLLFYAVTNQVTEEQTWEDEYGHRWVDPLLTSFDAWHYLLTYRNILTQSLTGFNEAMLMRHIGWQLPIGDPLGFPEYKAFSEITVRQALGKLPPSNPLPTSDFHPLRSGDMEITTLRLVDSFGQVSMIDTSGLVTTTQMHTERELHVALPPRITQPARLNMRWLAADGEQIEWNSHPAITPICGWLVADNLEGQIIIYDNTGALLGIIDIQGQWRPAPGRSGPTRAEDIDNAHLYRMVRHLCREGQANVDGEQTFIEKFAALVESALEQINPETAQHNQARALLMSRPVALLRVSINLELQEPYAVQQSHIAFARELQGEPRSTDDFEHVRFPLRIGEHTRFQDGVVGYWLEDNRGEFAQDHFYMPQSAWAAETDISVYRSKSGDFNHWLSLADEPMIVSVLMDPRGLLHASSGVLPTKALTLPPDEYLPALAQMQVSFLTAPLLTTRGQVQIALPAEAGWAWSWLADVDGSWERLPMAAVVTREALNAAFPGLQGEPSSQEIWQILLTGGALQAIPGTADEAFYHPEQLDNALQAIKNPPLEKRITQVLDTAARSIRRPMQPGHYAPQELREGWLQLSQHQETE